MRTKPTKINTTELCAHGCGCVANYKTISGKYICEEVSQKCPEIRIKNSIGLKKKYKETPNFNFKYSELSEETKAKMNWRKGKFSADFSYDGKGSHKKVLIEERGWKCESCNFVDWLGEPIPLELEHSDGDNRNNNKENLLLLCPNCHAKTEFYRGRNKNSVKTKVSDKTLLTLIKKGGNIRSILIEAGLTPKGGNYARIKKLMRV